MDRGVKVLLVGPYPPPHGGVSVHLRNVQALMRTAGVHCSVLNMTHGAPESRDYIRVSGSRVFVRELLRHAFDEWTFHVHTNGHNPRSWLLAIGCGLAAQMGFGGVLTLHSGMLADYLNSGPQWKRDAARLACLLYKRVICVNDEMAVTLERIGVPRHQLDVMPAFVEVAKPAAAVPESVMQWMSAREPVLSAVLAFRPEYGFEVLVSAVTRLRSRFPRLGCVVAGDGEDRREAEELIRREGLSEAILLAGDLGHQVCLTVIARSDLFVRPTWRDGDANSVREAVSMGVPVVASNVGTRPEGVMLFTAGDSNELAERIAVGLSAGARALTRSDSRGTSASRLMELYSF